MCLGIPGRVEEVREDAHGIVMGTVSFGGVTREVCLAYLPDVRPGEYVVVHVGFAISRVAEDEALEVFRQLEQLGEAAVPEEDAP